MSKIRFMYLRNKSGMPQGCLAIRLNNGVVEYNYSAHNPVDAFKRSVSRDVAAGRLVQNPITIKLLSQDDANMNSITRLVMLDLENKRTTVPARVAKSAKYWLDQGE